MAPGNEGGRTRRKGSTGRGDGGRAGRTVEKEVEQGGAVTTVDVDPWGAFFENFWEQAALCSRKAEGRPIPWLRRSPAARIMTTRHRAGSANSGGDVSSWFA